VATQSAPTSEFFADNVVTAQVLNVIKNAKHRIALVSPYVDRVGHVEQDGGIAIAQELSMKLLLERLLVKVEILKAAVTCPT